MGDDPYTSDGLSDAKGKAKKTVRVTKKQVIRKEERDRRKSVRHIRVTLRFDGVDGKRRVRSGEISEDQGVDPLTANDGASFTLTKLLFRNLINDPPLGSRVLAIFADKHWQRWKSLEVGSPLCGICKKSISISKPEVCHSLALLFAPSLTQRPLLAGSSCRRTLSN